MDLIVGGDETCRGICGKDLLDVDWLMWEQSGLRNYPES